MQSQPVEFIRLFRLPVMFPLCAGIAILLAALGKTTPAVGIIIGFSLFAANSLFLYEAGHSLLRLRSKRRGRAIAGLASLGRILFLAVALGAVARINHVAFFAASGGLIIAQLIVPLSYIRRRKEDRCSST